MNAIVFALSLVCLSSQPSNASPTPSQIMDEIARARTKAITSAHFQFEVRDIVNKNAKPYENIVRRFDMHFDDGQVRSIVKWTHPAWSKTTRSLITRSEFVEDWSSRDDVRMGSIEDKENPAREAFDPRVMGLYPTTISQMGGLKIDDLSRLYCSDAAVVSESEIDGEAAWLLSIKIGEESVHHIKVWVSRELLGRVLRVREETMGADGADVATVSVRNQYDHEADLFPSKCTYQSSGRGQTAMYQEITFSEKSINMPIDPITFTISGLGLEPGRRILDLDTNSMHEWDGRRLRPIPAHRLF